MPNFEKTSLNYRSTNQRSVKVKAKSRKINRISALDLASNIPFPLEPAEGFPMESLEVEKEYLITFKVYTSKNTAGVDTSFSDFFEILDVDQNVEDFIKAYWLYPGKIHFELVEAEPL